MISAESLDQLVVEVEQAIASGQDLEVLRTKYLGRNGLLTAMLKSLPEVSANERKVLGQKANKTKQQLERLLIKTDTSAASQIDLSLPISLDNHGHTHPVQDMIERLYIATSKLGFVATRTPEIESEDYNFDSLRVAKDHPARDMHDTFWTKNGFVLRTHTTAFQKHLLEQHKPPFAFAQGGKIFRSEAEDATHLSEFYHFDGFAVAKSLTMTDLKGTLYAIIKEVFGPETITRFRPAYFPFVEPGAEIDMQCGQCKGVGCKSCSHKGWLELLGCGMTHPEIIEAAGLDPNVYHGIAFGMGVERFTMLYHGITDIRDLVRNDPRLLENLT